MPNWKVNGPDFVQGFWLNNFKSIRKVLGRNLQKYLENKGRIILMQKDKENGKAASNYRPTTCLPLV